MNKKEFLKELEVNLSGKLNDDELKNILMDYDEIFESNKTENKTEEETAELIGSPAMVCKNILDDYADRKTTEHTKNIDYHLASLGRRIAAFIIDSILSLLPVAVFMGWPAGINGAVLLAPFNPLIFLSLGFYSFMPTAATIALNVTVLSIFWLYGTISMIILKNRTPGMLLMKIKVVKINNTKLKVFDIIGREFFGKVLIPGLTFGLSDAVSFFWALFSRTNNTVHDKIAGTLVVDNID